MASPWSAPQPKARRSIHLPSQLGSDVGDAFNGANGDAEVAHIEHVVAGMVEHALQDGPAGAVADLAGYQAGTGYTNGGGSANMLAGEGPMGLERCIQGFSPHGPWQDGEGNPDTGRVEISGQIIVSSWYCVRISGEARAAPGPGQGGVMKWPCLMLILSLSENFYPPIWPHPVLCPSHTAYSPRQCLSAHK